MEGLDQGPNGPIPRIVVDQFGYTPTSKKVAVLRTPLEGYNAELTSEYIPGPTLSLIDADTGNSVLTAAPAPWRSGAMDAASGDRTWSFDFSRITQEGRYFVADAENGLRSPEFEIAEGVYRPVLRAALRTFLYQRAGQVKSAATAGEEWQDGPSHVGPGQDTEARSWLAKEDPATARDLHGGWYDAGDYNRYSSWHADYLVTLLRVYAEHPDLVGDDLAIPESGNGVSDLLDEIAWGLEWLKRMQEPDGAVLCVLGVATGSPPSSATGPSFYGPATTNASLKAASAFAYAATVLASSGDDRLRGQASDLKRRALTAWAWAQANPSVSYFNNDDSLQAGSSGLAAGQQEVDDKGRNYSRFEAAVYLYELTNRPELRQLIDAQYATVIPTGSASQWTVGQQETLLHYAQLPNATASVAREIERNYLEVVETGEQFLPAIESQSDPYESPIREYTWGSNHSKAAMGRMFSLAETSALGTEQLQRRARAAGEGYLHYLHGVNPLGLVYLTNMASAGAEQSARTLFHSWFAEGSPWDEVGGSGPGPAPGFLVGGPNPSYSPDACCPDGCGGGDAGSLCALPLRPPLQQPATKAYLQFNQGWPVNSWEVTENSNKYQVQYLLLLASFVG
jgi:hypothetical protein